MVVFLDGGDAGELPPSLVFVVPATGLTKCIAAGDAYFPRHWYKVRSVDAPECIFQPLTLQNFSDGWGCVPDPLKITHYRAYIYYPPQHSPYFYCMTKPWIDQFETIYR